MNQKNIRAIFPFSDSEGVDVNINSPQGDGKLQKITKLCLAHRFPLV
jgi:hypothetical protein